MSEWQDIKLKLLCEKVTVGYVGPMANEYLDSGITFLRSLNIKPFRLELTDVKFVSEEFHHRIRKSALRPGDVVVVRTGYPGTAAVVPSSLSISNCSDLVIVRPGKDLNPHFITAIFNSAFGQTMVSGNTVGAAQQHFNITVAKELRFRVPPKPIQDKIAAVLSAYDELIENNERRIALLQKLSEEIYREWFVRFRFPGHEKSKRIKGVPEGWKVKELKEVADEVGKSTRPGTHLSERFYLPLDLLATKQMLPVGHAEYTEAQSSLVTFEKGNFLFGAMRPYQHKVAIAPFSGVTRTTCFVIRPRTEQSWAWLFLTLFQPSSVDYASLICNGSDRPYTVWNKGMERMKILWPDEGLVEKFGAVVRPMLDSVVSMYFLQRKLTACRDLLLPRLISGKLSVENLEIQFPPGLAEELSDAPTAAYA